MKVIKSNKIRCKKCNEIIESKNRHDFKWCKCKSCAVDGGTFYLKRCGNIEDWEDLSEFKEADINEKLSYIQNNLKWLSVTELDDIINIIDKSIS